MSHSPELDIPPTAANAAGTLSWKHAILLIAATWCLYGGTMGYPFLFDDQPNIRDNEEIRSWNGIKGMLASDGRPVAMLTFAGNYAVSKNFVWSYHLVNLLVHCAAGLTLYGLVRRTLLQGGTGSQADEKVGFPRESDVGLTASARSHASSIALAISLLWLVHPLQTQAVTYIVQRMESLCSLLFLLSMYALVRGKSSARPALWYLLTIVSCWLGMGCKQTMTACPIILLLYDRIFLAGSWKNVAPRWWVHAGTLLSFGWLAWLTHVAIAGEEVASAGFGLREITGWEYLRSQGGVLLHYLRLVIWPDVLCFDYVWPKATEPLAIWPQCGAILALLLTSFWLLWKHPRLGLVAVSFFFILAPSSSIVPIADLAFEHRMYLPLACVLILLVLGLFQLTSRLNLQPQQLAMLRTALVVLPAVLLGGRTMLRNRDYASEMGMWQLIARQRPANARAFKNIAHLHHHAGRRDLAIENYERAIELDPKSYVTFVEYGNIYYAERDYARALSLFRQAAVAGPDQALPLLNVALVLSKTGQMQEALDACDQALARFKTPVSRQERKIRAWVLSTAADARLRNGEEALRLLKTLKPLKNKTDVDLLDRYAAAFAETGDFAKAVDHEQRAIADAKLQKAPEHVLAEYASRLKLYEQQQPCRILRGESKME
ncbi:MAG: tetratricopeptide repeat protein [Pirellulaceae bacterium]